MKFPLVCWLLFLDISGASSEQVRVSGPLKNPLAQTGSESRGRACLGAEAFQLKVLEG